MAKRELPLEEMSIEQLFIGGEQCTYEIPIYQRNYAWEKDEISALVQDIYDAFQKDANKPYYIGTLVSYHKGDRVFEVIDGQQRLTTIRLMLGALGIQPRNHLTYRARRRSDRTIRAIPDFEKFEPDERDAGIENGFRYAKSSIDEIVPVDEKNGFVSYFRNCVHIIHYQVPKDIDLNHYFEIMNSRGEQLEKHEIVKANLMEKLDNDEERKVFNRIWECCAEMSVYVQQNLSGVRTDSLPEEVFGKAYGDFLAQSFDEFVQREQDSDGGRRTIRIADIIDPAGKEGWAAPEAETERKDSFQPIIDFPNFLLIVLKITRMSEPDFQPDEFKLDDKELLSEFYKASMDAVRVRTFAFNLLKARFYLDNYVVHHSKEEDTVDNNPWKLQVWFKNPDIRKGQLRNLTDDKPLEDRLTHLLSMFEVSFTARQRKNYLFYCLFYLLTEAGPNRDIAEYAAFVEGLADRYFHEVYLDGSKLNAINTPLPNSFDEVILEGHRLRKTAIRQKDQRVFEDIYGDGAEASRGVPLFLFNYLDFKLWKRYEAELRGEGAKRDSRKRQEFFGELGCTDFGLDLFDQFYFSRTRRSLEHYYAQALATGKDGALNQDQINCLGNYAMIGSEANSSGSNWSPKTKLDHYLDSSVKINPISVASLKFMIMMRMCRDRQTWEFDEIREHQERMLGVLFGVR